QTSVALPITAPAVQVQNALNALSNIVNDVGSVIVTRAGNIYTIVFGTAHSQDVPLLIATPLPAPAMAEVSVSGTTTVDGSPSEAPLVNLSQDSAWRGPVTLDVG